VLPNAWGVGSARAVVDASFPVVATASNAIAAALGYHDGEGAPSEEKMFVAQRIAASVLVGVNDGGVVGRWTRCRWLFLRWPPMPRRCSSGDLAPRHPRAAGDAR
jgi:hypothetical protein